MKSFIYEGEEITITEAGYRQYRIEGLGTSVYTSDIEIYEGCDDPKDKERRESSREAAYLLLAQ